jgi:MFS family permease
MNRLIAPTVGRRLVGTLFVTQSLASAGYIANIAVNTILGKNLSGSEALAGLPGTLLLLGAAASAYPAGRLMQRIGRRYGLTLGFLLGLLGMLASSAAVVLFMFPLLLLGVLLIGSARGVTDQSRYAAADAQPLDQRGKAISTIVFAGTIGAVGGPALVGPAGQIAARVGIDPLAGPMLAGAVLFAVAAVLLFATLRPDPRAIAEALAVPPAGHTPAPEVSARSWRMMARVPEVQLGVVAMVFGQVVMVTVMSMVSLHMYNHEHGLGEVSLVIAAHTLGMFGLSFFTGALADRFGRRAIIGAGALVLIAGCVIAPFSLQTPLLALALFLVGLGWNGCYVSGSSLLADALTPGERGAAQGAADLAVNFAAAASSLSSGLVMALLGFGALCAIGSVLALVPLILMGAQGVSVIRKPTELGN